MNIIEYIKKDKIKRFNSTIYYRGLEYYEQELIEDVVYSNNSVSATITGNAKYKTSIIFDKTNLNFSCTCPFEGNCKHEAALYIYVLKTEFDDFKEENDKDIITVCNKVSDIIRDIQIRLGNEPVLSYANYSSIKDLVRLAVVLLRNALNLKNEKINLLVYRLLDTIISADNVVNNSVTKEMYRSVNELVVRSIKTEEGLKAFQTHLLSCNLFKTIEVFFNLPNEFISLSNKDILGYSIILFEYLYRVEIVIPNKKETLTTLAHDILEIYYQLSMLDEYEKFVEQYHKYIPDIEVKYYQLLYKNGNYEKIIDLYHKDESEYLECYIIYLAVSYILKNNNNGLNLLINVFKQSNDLDTYLMIKKYFPIDAIVSIKDELIEIVKNKQKSSCYLHLCKDTGLIDKAFEYCIKAGIDTLSENYQIFLGTYDHEMILYYQEFLNKKLIKADLVEYGLRNYYIEKIYQMLKMKNGKYYVYGFANKYIEKSQYSILRGEMLSILHSLNFGV